MDTFTIFLFAVVLFVAFIYFLRQLHSQPSLADHKISKLYVDAHIIELEENDLIIDGQTNNDIHLGHFEELIEVLNRCAMYKEIFNNYKIYVAVNHIIGLPKLQNYIHGENFMTVEETQFREDLRYGGCYFQNKDGGAMIHAIGEPDAILNLCSQIHDTEEILRVSQKWIKQGYLVSAVATADVYGDKKNVLVRGVKEKMVFLGLLAIKNS